MRRGLLLIYTGLLVYGSLFPFVGWNFANWPNAIQGLLGWPHWRPRSDMITNLLVYIPFGVLLVSVLPRPAHSWHRGLIAVLLAMSLSLGMELLQAALPGRVASLRDLFWNTLGAALGVSCYVTCANSRILRALAQSIRANWLREDSLPTVGIAVLTLWLLAQWLPLSVDFDLQRISAEVQQLWHRLQHPQRFSFTLITVEFLQLLGVGLIWLSMARPQRRALTAFTLAILVATVAQLILIDRRIQPERIAALCLLLPFLLALHRHRPLWPSPRWTSIAIVALIAAFIIEGVDSRFPWGVVNRDFNWLPFIGNIGRIHSLAGLAETLWIFTGLAYLCVSFASATKNEHRIQVVAYAGLIGVLILSFMVEWIQTGFPDRWADVTDPLLAATGWLLVFWFYHSLSRVQTPASKRA